MLAHEFLDSVLLLAVVCNKDDGFTEVFLQIEANAVIWDTGIGRLDKTSSLKRCYQQADEATMLEITKGGTAVRR